MQTKLTLLFFFIYTALNAADDSNSLRLDVYPVPLSREVEVHSIITNTSDHSITVPTSSYSGGADAWSSGHWNIGIFFIIGFGEIGKHKLVPAPSRYHPVTLLPGESTELPVMRPKLDGDKTVEVAFSVDKECAERYGWWHGCLRKKVTIGEGENPYIVTDAVPSVRELPNLRPELKTGKLAVPSSSTPTPGVAQP